MRTKNERLNRLRFDKVGRRSIAAALFTAFILIMTTAPRGHVKPVNASKTSPQSGPGATATFGRLGLHNSASETPLGPKGTRPGFVDVEQILRPAATDSYNPLLPFWSLIGGTNFSPIAMPVTQPVSWTNAVGVLVTDYGLKSTAASGWGNAGASSTSAIVAGDGYVEFTANETNLSRMCGLSSDDSNQGWQDIDYAIYVAYDASVSVYEAGRYVNAFGTYAAGDRFRVSVEGGAVKYSRNGAVFYTSTVAPTYPLLVDTALAHTGATLADVTLSGLLQNAPERVVWTNVTTNVTATGNSLQKSATGAVAWDAGAVSTRALYGNGSLDFTASETNTDRIVGLSYSGRVPSYGAIDFGLRQYYGSLYIIESNGANRGNFGPYVAGDRLRISLESGTIKYWQIRSGVTSLLYTSTLAPKYPMAVDSCLYDAGATINSVTLSGAIVNNPSIPRTPYAGTSFNASPLTVPGTIEAEQFDNGGEAIAYNDTTPGSHGQNYNAAGYPPSTFRSPTDVDIYEYVPYSDGKLVLMQAGDWMNYTVNVARTDSYTFQAQVAWGGTSGSPGTFHLEVDGIDRTGPIQITDTGWAFQIISTPGIQLSLGQHVIRLAADTDASNGYTGDVDFIRFVPPNQPPTANANGPYAVTLGDAVQLRSDGSFDPDGTITGYSWNFGDGTSSTEMAPAHVYSSAGIYNVTLTVTDNSGASASSSTTATVSAPVDAAVFVSQSVPATMNAGQSYQVSVTMRNSGTSTWTTDDNFNLGSQNPQDNTTWGLQRVAVSGTVAPGAPSTFSFTVKAPATPGTYNFRWRPIHGASIWFGDYTSNVVVTVTGPPASASFVRHDTSTHGNWKGIFGGEGHTVIGDSVSNPAYAQVTWMGNSAYTWAPSTNDPRALQKVNSGDRIASTWYSGSEFNIDLNLTDGQSHQVALYCLDWDNYNGRAERLEVFDAVSNALLDSRNVSDFVQGQYVVWNLFGHVRIRVTNVGGSTTNAVVSGLFFDTAPVGYWRFDEATGTSAGDLSARSNDGTLTNGVGWYSAGAGSVLSFDGVDDYLQVGANRSLVMSSAVTVGAWIFPTGPGSDLSDGGIIVNKEGEYEVARFADGTIRWAFANTNPGWNWVDTGYVAPLNRWTHLVVVYDNGTVKTYANGSLVHTYNGAGLIGDVATSFNDFRIGGRASGVQYFQGYIDEVLIYNQALSQFTVGMFSSVSARSQNADAGNLSLSIESEPAALHPGRLVKIGFDDLPNNVIIPANYSSDVVFSTDTIIYPIHTYQSCGTCSTASAPNFISTKPYNYGQVNLKFTKAVNDLSFYVVGIDDYNSNTIGKIAVYTSGKSTPDIVNLLGCDTYIATYNPKKIDLSNYTSVTGISIYQLSDRAGLGFDQFEFTVPDPTPTPSPSPSPTPIERPRGPQELKAEAGEGQVVLSWFASEGATSYRIQRSLRSSGGYVDIKVLTALPPPHGVYQRISYTDTQVENDKSYYYIVFASNSAGESYNSSNESVATPHVHCGKTSTDWPHRPVPQIGAGWSMTSEVTERDGLVVRDVSLNGNKMAKMISAPYFYVKTNKMAAPQRGELTPDSNAQTMRVRLISYFSSVVPLISPLKALLIRAQYAVDRFAPSSNSCLIITQNYIFYSSLPDDLCEPSGLLACSRFYPFISYEFQGRDDEKLEMVNIPQRLHLTVQTEKNSIGLFHDCDSIFGCIRGGGLVFDRKQNPLSTEILETGVIKNGEDKHKWDNLHQTPEDKVIEPLDNGSPAGCPECAHIHWRWGAYIPDVVLISPPNFPIDFIRDLTKFRGGRPIIGDRETPTNQDLDIAVVRYKPGEEHPTNFASLVDRPPERIRNVVGYKYVTPITPPGVRVPSTKVSVEKPVEVVFWYSPTSHEPLHDGFFTHGGFMNPNSPKFRAVLDYTPTHAPAAAASVPDRPTAITFGHLFREGQTTLSNIDPSTVGPLPSGYTAYNNIGYQIQTRAVVSGPHDVTFTVPSATDQASFDRLRIFYAETDPFDPDGFIWVDSTVLSPDSPAPDFASRTITARVSGVGKFVIGRFDESQFQPQKSSDLSVAIGDSPDPGMSGNNLNYTVTVTNNGPDAATGAGLINGLPPESEFVSATASQGSCKFEQGRVYCKLGTINAGAHATITVVVTATESEGRFPSEGKLINSTAFTASDCDDLNTDDNTATETTRIFTNPNTPPAINITSPTNGSTVVGPTNINLTAKATDSEGPISSVAFYDNGELIGSASASGPNEYSLNWSGADYGAHILQAVATDSGGRKNASAPVSVQVNGSAKVNIISPATGNVLPPGSSPTIVAQATTLSGSISKVEFWVNGTIIGAGSSNGAGQYSLLWSSPPSGNYSLMAIATDSAGVKTFSSLVNFAITKAPTVSITDPTEGKSYAANIDRITVAATGQDDDGFIVKVDLYANGELVGTTSGITQNQFTINWDNIADGLYTLTAVATDNFGAATRSAPVNIAVNRATPIPGEYIWYGDNVPQGATVSASGGDGWSWVDSNPGPLWGERSHQSSLAAGVHGHDFRAATEKLPVSNDDRLYTYVFLDPDNMPRELMLQWNDGSWEHRAYWGADAITAGVNGTVSRRYMGVLPVAGRWVRLEVPAALVGLGGANVNGMAFTLDGGRATWSRTGKLTPQFSASAPAGSGTAVQQLPPPVIQPEDEGDSAGPASGAGTAWFNGTIPSGAHADDSLDDVWSWVNDNVCPDCGQSSHRSKLGEEKRFHSHSFSGASSPLTVNPGDVLFAYVYIDPTYKPDQLMLQWNDGESWEHRAYWGNNFLANLNRTYIVGALGTESQRYMGGMPPAGQWVRLEIPASYVGLEGKAVSGMAFGYYREQNKGLVTWGCAGTASAVSTPPFPLHATAPLWRFFSSQYGYSFSTNDIGRADSGSPTLRGYVFPNRAAGTIPIFRYRSASSRYFYTYDQDSVSTTDKGGPWTYDGIAFYVYPNDKAPGTDEKIPGLVPLYIFYDRSKDFYFYTTDRDGESVPEMVYQNVVLGYIYLKQSTNPIEDSTAFVRQHYRDFLNREPEQSGLDYWAMQLQQCGGDGLCLHRRRVAVSAAFFIEQEFQQTGYFVYRLYKASFNRRPTFDEFMADRSLLFVLNLDASKQALINDWVARAEFHQAYPNSMSAAQYVDTLNADTGNSLTQSERNALVQGLGSSSETRASVLAKVVENAVFQQREYNPAFVLMQYFGYLRRDPEQDGFDFWLDVLNNREPNNYRGMVCSFITSAEYQKRFGPAVTRTNKDCSWIQATSAPGGQDSPPQSGGDVAP